VRRLLLVWGILGVILLLVSALYRLAPIAWVPIRDGMLTTFHWVVVVIWTLISAHAEGYKGFQKKFSPRTVARAVYLGHHPTPLRAILAPFFCMGLFDATKKVFITAWAVTIGVIILVIIIRALDQPWRGIIDIGVVVGLGWGLASLLVFFVQALLGRPPAFDPGIPDRAKSTT
jgi:hypothetical protein